MRVRLAYGKTGLDVELPDDAVVVAPEHRDAVPDPAGALRAALRHPVAAAAHLGHTEDIGATVREALMPGARVCVLPEGPQTIPYVTDHQFVAM